MRLKKTVDASIVNERATGIWPGKTLKCSKLWGAGRAAKRLKGKTWWETDPGSSSLLLVGVVSAVVPAVTRPRPREEEEVHRLCVAVRRHRFSPANPPGRESPGALQVNVRTDCLDFKIPVLFCVFWVVGQLRQDHNWRETCSKWLKLGDACNPL